MSLGLVSVQAADTPNIPKIDCGQEGVLIGCDQNSGEVALPSDARFGTLIQNILNTIIGLFALIAVIFVVKGGITLILSLGNDEKMKTARNTILYALVGLFVSTLAYVIVSIVSSIKLF